MNENQTTWSKTVELKQAEEGRSSTSRKSNEETVIKSGQAERTRVDEDADQVVASEGQQNRGIDQIQVVSHGLKLIVINDSDNNFLPVLSTNFSNFKVQWDHNAKQSCFWTDLNSSINFFNVSIGVWEPFVEQFGVKLMINQEVFAQKQNIQLTFTTPVNVNFTEQLVQNLYESQMSWQQVSENFESLMLEQEAIRKKFEELNPRWIQEHTSELRSKKNVQLTRR